VATLVGTLVLMFSAVPAAHAAVTVGQLAFEDNPTNCTPATALVTTEVAALTPFSAPSSGVITSWQTKAGDGSGGTDAKLKIFRATANPDQFLVVGQSAFQPITASSVNGPFPVRIPVEAGDYVSIRTGSNGGPCLSQTAIEADVSRVTQGEPDTPTGSTTFFVGTNTQQRANVAATLEPDGDRDGWGDETQDRCVGVPGPIEGCPDNNFQVAGAVALKNGFARLTVNVPGPGTVTAQQASSQAAASKKKKRKKGGALIRPATAQAGGAGAVTLTLKPSSAGRKRLAKKGRMSVPVSVSFTPTGYVAKSALRWVQEKASQAEEVAHH
jgi:hypothetical protein